MKTPYKIRRFVWVGAVLLVAVVVLDAATPAKFRGNYLTKAVITAKLDGRVYRRENVRGYLKIKAPGVATEIGVLRDLSRGTGVRINLPQYLPVNSNGLFRGRGSIRTSGITFPLKIVGRTQITSNNRTIVKGKVAGHKRIYGRSLTVTVPFKGVKK